ncbi:hypothetical protein DIX90_01035 [Streptococcus iniae]|nr:stage II sporulation protein M [Streptococcus iniae]AJG25262.1 integral membrane protein [Streptococcus iniae]ATX38987.1 hypothetical protein CTW00_00786 [Streptococcus iniae]EKB52351.1 integral membrane protein [Streptococcus iniae 9117]ELY5748577.1 stage II sporulation protein M [Streptococcus iniae]ELY5750224.1 stage II sporulation protein M [Streptococcus iniae]
MFVDKTYQKTSDFMLYAVILLVLTTVVTYAINPNTSRLVTAIATKIPTKLSQANGMEKVMIYIQHNAFTVPLKMLLLALLPIPFLFLIHLLLSVTILGIAFAIVLRYDAGQGMALILSSLPHSFFELFGICLFASLLYRLNNALYHSLYVNLPFYQKEKCYCLKEAALSLLKVYFFLVLPIISFAAICETYLTEYIYSFFH